MAAPPPQGEDAEPEAIAFGIAAVDAILEDTELAFPATGQEVLEAVGDHEIPYDPRGRSIQLSAALEATDRTTFESRRELLNALHPVFEAKRDKGGLGGWVRSILPF